MATHKLINLVKTSENLSRRKAEELIKDGMVSINTKITINPFVEVDPTIQQIAINDKIIGEPESLQKSYYLFNKPIQLLCSKITEKGKRTIFEFLKARGLRDDLLSVGRLDFMTSGLLLLTNDGSFANKMSHPSFKIEKVYKVGLDRALADGDLIAIRKGIRLEDGLVESKVRIINPRTILLTITSGKNRIVRRIFERLRYQILSLTRVRQGNFLLGNLKIGEFKKLSAAEISNFL